MTTHPFRKTILFAVLLAAALAWEVLPGRTVHADDVTVEVASWNMRWFPSGYMEPQSPDFETRRVMLTARHMRRQGVPDVFFAQEIRSLAVCRELASQLDDEAFRPVVCSAFVDAETNEPVLLQLAIFSRHPAVETGFERWHAADWVSPPRGCAWAVLDIGGEYVACFNVHLKSNFIPEGLDVEQQTVLNRLKREISARQLLARIEALRKDGVNGRPITGFIIAGDFNTALDDARFETETTVRGLLSAGFTHAHAGLKGEAHATLPASKYYPATTFDFILFRGLSKRGDPVVLPSVWISDHREIRATLDCGR